MLPIYYRNYTTHAFLGSLFGVDDSAVGRNINPLQPLLAGIFRSPERRFELDSEEIRALFHAAAERPTRRPMSGTEGRSAVCHDASGMTPPSRSMTRRVEPWGILLRC